MSYIMAQLNPGLLAQFTPLPAFLQTCIILWRLVESKEAIAMCMCQTHPSSLIHGWVYFVSCVDTSHERRSGTQKMKYTQAFIPHTLIKFTFWIHSQQSCMEVSCSFPPACYELSPGCMAPQCSSGWLSCVWDEGIWHGGCGGCVLLITD